MGRLGRETICPLMSLNQVVVFVMGRFELNSDDVVSMKAEHSLLSTQTFKVDQANAWLKGKVSNLPEWLEKGMACEVLSASQGGGWKKGKIRIRFEFIEDEPQTSEPPASLDIEE